jgi:FtsZ-binding cell division protein ZapB
MPHFFDLQQKLSDAVRQSLTVGKAPATAIDSLSAAMDADFLDDVRSGKATMGEVRERQRQLEALQSKRDEALRRKQAEWQDWKRQEIIARFEEIERLEERDRVAAMGNFAEEGEAIGDVVGSGVGDLAGLASAPFVGPAGAAFIGGAAGAAGSRSGGALGRAIGEKTGRGGPRNYENVNPMGDFTGDYLGDDLPSPYRSRR